MGRKVMENSSLYQATGLKQQSFTGLESKPSSIVVEVT
jgi:hypothetical protein